MIHYSAKKLQTIRLVLSITGFCNTVYTAGRRPCSFYPSLIFSGNTFVDNTNGHILVRSSFSSYILEFLNDSAVEFVNVTNSLLLLLLYCCCCCRRRHHRRRPHHHHHHSPHIPSRSFTTFMAWIRIQICTDVQKAVILSPSIKLMTGQNTTCVRISKDQSKFEAPWSVS